MMRGKMKRRRLLFIFLFLALTLMACNLTNMLPGNDRETEPAVESTSDAELNTITEEPEQSPEFVEDATPEPESESMDSSESSSPASTGSQSACDHPYFPLREGARWVYYDSSDVYYYHWEVETVSGDMQNANAVMQVYITEFDQPSAEQKQAATQIEYNWVCSAEKGIVSFDLATLNVANMGDDSFTMTMENVEGEGVLLPPADVLQPGYTWEMTINSDFNAESFMGATGSMQSTDFYTVLSTDPVEVNGETFEGLQFQRQFDNDMQLMLNGVEVALPNIDFDFETYTVMAKGIGYVKLDSDSDFGTTGLQLIRYNIP
jgi:hypothetical protein